METFTDRISTYRQRCASLEPWLDERMDHFLDVDLNLWPGRLWKGGDDPKNTASQNGIITSYAQLRFRSMNTGLVDGTCPQSFRWYALASKIAEDQEDHEFEGWLYRETDAQYRGLSSNGCNYYEKYSLMLDDSAHFGVGAVYVEKDIESTTRYEDLRPGTYAIGYDSKGRPDKIAIYRRYTISQLVEKFGYENVSENVRRDYDDKKNLENKIEVTQLIWPNEDYVKGDMRGQYMEWASCWFENTAPTVGDKFLRESGLPEFRMMIFEWDKHPAWYVLKEIRQLYRQELDKNLAADMELSPPTVGPGSLAPQDIDKQPGGHTPTPDGVDSKSFSRLFEFKMDVSVLLESMQKVKEIIDEGTYYHVLNPTASLDPTKVQTATYVERRAQDLLRQIGPVALSITPVLNHHEDILFSIRSELRLVEPWPDTAAGKDFTPDYVSSIMLAQKMSKLEPSRKVLLQAQEIFTWYPQIIDAVVPEEHLQETARVMRANPKGYRSDKEIAAIRQERARQEMETQASVNAREQAVTASTLNEEIQPNSLLEQLAKAGGA